MTGEEGEIIYCDDWDWDEEKIENGWGLFLRQFCF